MKQIEDHVLVYLSFYSSPSRVRGDLLDFAPFLFLYTISASSGQSQTGQQLGNSPREGTRWLQNLFGILQEFRCHLFFLPNSHQKSTPIPKKVPYVPFIYSLLDLIFGIFKFFSGQNFVKESDDSGIPFAKMFCN